MTSRILRSILLCILVSTAFARLVKYSSTQQQNDLLEAKAESLKTKQDRLYQSDDDEEDVVSINGSHFIDFTLVPPAYEDLELTWNEECTSDWKIGTIDQIYQDGIKPTVTVNKVGDQYSSPTSEEDEGMSLTAAHELAHYYTQVGEPKYAYKYIDDLECLDSFMELASGSADKLSSTLVLHPAFYINVRETLKLSSFFLAVLSDEELAIDNSDFVPYRGDISRSRNSDSGEGETSPPPVPRSGTPKTKYPIGGTTKVPLVSE